MLSFKLGNNNMLDDYKYDFEKLEVYQKAVQYTNTVFEITKKFTKNNQFSLGDQFRRAALSICNNLAEGSGKRTSPSKRQYYSISLDSARECIPIITVSLTQAEMSKTDADKLRTDCIIICKMLFKLIESVH